MRDFGIKECLRLWREPCATELLSLYCCRTLAKPPQNRLRGETDSWKTWVPCKTDPCLLEYAVSQYRRLPRSRQKSEKSPLLPFFVFLAIKGLCLELEKNPQNIPLVTHRCCRRKMLLSIVRGECGGSSRSKTLEEHSGSDSRRATTSRENSQRLESLFYFTLNKWWWHIYYLCHHRGKMVKKYSSEWLKSKVAVFYSFSVFIFLDRFFLNVRNHFRGIFK